MMKLLPFNGPRGTISRPNISRAVFKRNETREERWGSEKLTTPVVQKNDPENVVVRMSGSDDLSHLRTFSNDATQL